MGGRERAYLSMISLFQHSEGDCRADAVVYVGRWSSTEERKILTGRDNKAEGESLKVRGWVSPIAGWRDFCQARGKKPFRLSFFYLSRHVGEAQKAVNLPKSIQLCLSKKVRRDTEVIHFPTFGSNTPGAKNSRTEIDFFSPASGF